MKNIGKLLALVLALAMLLVPLTLTVSAAETNLLYVGVQEGGSVSGTSSGSYAPGTPVSVTATAGNGYRFDGWTITGAAITGGNSANPATFTMPDGEVTLIAKMHDTGDEYIWTLGCRTQWLRTPLNGFLKFCLFGWIWMLFINPSN